MKYVSIPVAMLEVGKPLPVDVWSGSGQLLLRKGQPVTSEEHRQKLHAHNASSTPTDALAWQRSYERMVHAMLRDGVDVQAIARAPMPSEIRESDYVVGASVNGGWLDLQEMLRGILYQGGLAINPLNRMAGIRDHALSLLQADPDDSLFCLFQALADDSLGYSATHALLCLVACELTAQKIALDADLRRVLVDAALTMNIGMARDQDSLSRQQSQPNTWQRTLIQDHPEISVGILKGFGVDDTNWLDVVRWHHKPLASDAQAETVLLRRILHLADSFVAKAAARKTRAAQAPVKAVKSMVLGAETDGLGIASAMAQSVGFYPPGSYVRLLNGETAVSVQRGERANTPWVVSILDKEGVALGNYVTRDTRHMPHSIQSPVGFESIKVRVSLDKVRKLRSVLPT
jgi:HD-GYP domain-containing protein (c-di-GMP phosphodiesterase class II)